MVAIYAVVIFICLLCLKKSAFRLILIELYILILFSIGPLLIVSKYVYRTFYLTFILLFVFACYLLKEVAKHLSPYLTKDLKVTFKKVVPVVFATAFVFLSMNIFIQTSYNYNFYVVRTQYIAEQVNMDAETIYIPTLPCKAIVCEDEHPSSLSDIIYKTSAKSRIAEQNMVYCENIDSYNAVLSKNPVSSILYSFSNLQYKSPHTIFSLIQNN